ncbi:MAG: hypothetical protein JRG71_16515 [Deltaproteobacteria bacterium]|nr:hypothetical protein [Deltaproteobacteria bacterium]
MKLAAPEFSFDDSLERRLFTRRSDLTETIRLTIANNALNAILNGGWGRITELAGQFLCKAKTEDPLALTQERKRAIEMMLSIRLESCSSIGSVSTVMKRQACDLSSIGSISQTLSRIGGLLPMTIDSQKTIQYLVFASDEIFSKARPILVTVDPCSSAILRIELSETRHSNDWKKHFECLMDNGMEAIYLVSDDGVGLRAGHSAALSHTVRQSDTYHAVAHTLGSWVDRLEISAYKAIKEDYEREQKVQSAKSKQAKEKQQQLYQQSQQVCEAAIREYEEFSYLYYCIINELNIFDNEGHLRHKQQAQGVIETGLQLIEELNNEGTRKAAQKVMRTLPDLFHYFDIAEGIVKDCKTLVDDETLKAYCLAWQWGKAIRKAKKSGRKQSAKQQEKACLESAEWWGEHGIDQENWHQDIQKEIYAKLDKIVQSSALVECINSIIRPYFNTSKNQISQEQLNLIMHYHNHRRYLAGVRKHKTPMEILTSEDQTKDWIEILFDIIEEKAPELFLA